MSNLTKTMFTLTRSSQILFLRNGFKQSIGSVLKFQPSCSFSSNDEVDQNELLKQMRNIGIAAHIDSGKTTVTERLLFYTGRISEMHEVKGKDKVGATMDSMDLERERGITIQSAATHVEWKGNRINIIDTPGHVDFTVEVERALRVLDGAVLVICANGGVQSQTLTVNRQINRYSVPSIIFINKIDRLAANPFKCLMQIRTKLKRNAAFLQIPIGLESKCSGIVDLINRKALYFEGVSGQNIVEKEIPEDLKSISETKRKELIECVSDVDDELAEIFLLDEEPTVDQLMDAIRRTTIARTFMPVLMGTALKNKGVQPLLDAITSFLPNPSEVNNYAVEASAKEGEKGTKTLMNPERTADNPAVAFAFKLEQSKFGQLTYLRLYQGSLIKGNSMFNVRTKKKVRISRLVRMHSNKLQDLTESYAGDICALFGVECATGDTFVGKRNMNYSMESIFVPEPVISMSMKSSSKRENEGNISKALNRFTREDPTFRQTYDPESKEIIVSGMGELHLEIYAQRMRNEYGLEVVLGKPKVAFLETINDRVEFDYTHKRQSGGAGQYGRLVGYAEPLPDDQIMELVFENKTVGTNVPNQYMNSIKKGFLEDMCEKGPQVGAKLSGIKFVILDGASHAVDSSEIAFRLCAQGAALQAITNSPQSILEPIMKVEITCPGNFHSVVLANLNKKHAHVLEQEHGNDNVYSSFVCEVSLNDMFGFVGELRSITEGKGEYTMEFTRYQRCRSVVEEQLISQYEAAQNPTTNKVNQKQGRR